ncbi:MAG: LacI family DNA-binding transcriptional regulator [Candidatus Limiplasma sp.]|nr:LacI family DNA-binding transcriptional regulator [Candidatus Limiplasma sp.]
MTIHDISKLANVSVATVSRVLNGNPNVTAQTKEKVMAVIREKNYTPNAFARGLGLDTMRTVGILCVDPADPDACPSLQFAIGYLQRELRRQDFDSLLYCIGYDMREKERSIQAMLNRRVDAIIIIGSFFIESNAKNNLCILNAAQTTPVWLVNGNLENISNVYCTRCDDCNGAYRATRALLDSGCKDVLMLHYASTYSEQQKISGYKQALAERGLPVREEYICETTPDVQEVAEKISGLLRDGVAFDGLIGTEDELAVSALKVATAYGLSVPDQLRVVGYSNSKLALFSMPELTSVDHNIESLCVTTVALLTNQLRGMKTPAVTTVMADIVYRKTLPSPYGN